MAQTNIVQKVREALEKHFKDSEELFIDFGVTRKIEVIPTKSSIINAVTGIGGFPRGRVTELFGGFSSGKTTIATETSALLQSINPNARTLYVDMEHAFDGAYGHHLGLDLDPDKFIMCQPRYFEQGARIVDDFIEQDLVDLIFVDSAAAMIPKSVMEGHLEDGTGSIGEQARLFAQMLAKTTKTINQGRKPALVLLNQTRAKIDVKNARNNEPEASASGNAIKFYSSLRLKLEIVYSEGEEGRGTKGTDQLYTQNRIRVTAIKNKLAPPFVRGLFVIEYGRGTNNALSIAELAEARLGIMSGAGFFSYQGDTTETNLKCRGREEFQSQLIARPDLLAELERKVLDAIRMENAKALGLTEMKLGAAKVMDPNATVLTGEDEEGTIPLEE